MNFSENIFQYLNKRKFSNGLVINLHGKNYNLNRIELTRKILFDKKVVHIGCADHLPLIEEKMIESTWLHGEMDKVTKQLIGLDINKEAISFIRKKGIENVHFMDVISDDLIDEVKNEAWDYLFLGELVEHVNDPVLFLKAISEKFGNNAEYVVLTVPNAFRFANFKLACGGKELINSDHRYWFTPYTIAKVLTEAGMGVTEYFMIDAFSSKKLLQRLRRRFFPMLSDTIVMVAKLKNG